MTHTVESSKFLSLPSEKLSGDALAEKLQAARYMTGVIPHSTRELNMMIALADPIYEEDGVPSYINEVVGLDQEESSLSIARDIVGFYRDAITNLRDLASLMQDIDETGQLQPRNPAVYAAVQRYQAISDGMKNPGTLDLDIDQEYTSDVNADYANTLMSQTDQTGSYNAFERMFVNEMERASFWQDQITAYDMEIAGERVSRQGLIDSMDPQVMAYFKTIIGLDKQAYDDSEQNDPVFSIGKRPKQGDTAAWEKFKHRNRLNDIVTLHSFLPQSNNEAYKIKNFDRLKYDPSAVLKWVNMINESNRRTEVALGKDVDPKSRLDNLIGGLSKYAHDAAQNAEHGDFVLNLIDEKSNDEALFADSFPADEWFRDYPEYRVPFVKLAEFLQTEEFIQNGRVDNITKKARAKKARSVQDEIDLILSKMGTLPLGKVAEIADRYVMDQTNRFAYWESVIKMTRQHGTVTALADYTLSRLNNIAPRYNDPDSPRTALEPTFEFEQPF